MSCQEGFEHSLNCLCSYQWPNEQDDPAQDRELKVGDTVYFTSDYDEWDRPVASKHTPLTIVRVGNSCTSFDYEVQSPSGNRFGVKLDEIDCE